MRKIRNLKVNILAFPVTEYNRPELDEKTPEELLVIAKENPNCQAWDNLEQFETSINANRIDVDNNWILFVTDE